MVITAALADTLAMIGPYAADAKDPWWIIGSAAVAMQGGHVSHIKDVDLMMSAHDAERFLTRVGSERRQPDLSDRFRSLIFGAWSAPPIPVEVFGGFSLAIEGRWREVALTTREPKTVAGAEIYVPSVEELVLLLKMFGRPKDLARAKLLES